MTASRTIPRAGGLPFTPSEKLEILSFLAPAFGAGNLLSRGTPEKQIPFAGSRMTVSNYDSVQFPFVRGHVCSCFSAEKLAKGTLRALIQAGLTLEEFQNLL